MSTPITPQMRASLRDHVLTEMLGGADVRVFRMHRPGTRIMSVDLVVTAGRIWLSGDLTIGDGYGVISSLGCDLAWFSGRLGWDYLASKFLRKRFVQDLAERAVRDKIAEIRAEYVGATMPDEEAFRVRRLDEALVEANAGGSVFRSGEAFTSFWLDTVGEPDGEGHGYDPIDAGWLAAVQERFAELYAAMPTEKAA